MKLVGEEGSLSIECRELGAPGTPADGDLHLYVTVEVRGFSGADFNWVSSDDWKAFLCDFRALESRRQGKACLVSMSPDELRLEFLSTDRLGHMAVQGQVCQRTPRSFDLRLQFGFAFEPDRLPWILQQLESFGRR